MRHVHTGLEKSRWRIVATDRAPRSAGTRCPSRCPCACPIPAVNGAWRFSVLREVSLRRVYGRWGSRMGLRNWVFKTVEGVKAPWRVRFPSASAGGAGMWFDSRPPPRESPSAYCWGGLSALASPPTRRAFCSGTGGFFLPRVSRGRARGGKSGVVGWCGYVVRFPSASARKPASSAYCWGGLSALAREVFFCLACRVVAPVVASRGWSGGAGMWFDSRPPPRENPPLALIAGAGSLLR